MPQIHCIDFYYFDFSVAKRNPKKNDCKLKCFKSATGLPEKHILQCVKDLKGRLRPSKHQVLSTSLMNKQFAKLIFICFCF